VDSSGIVRR